MTRHTARVALALLVATLFTACAAGGGGRRAADEVVSVRVHNDLRPASEVTVRMISDAGVRQILGSISPQDTRTLQFAQGPFAGTYQLVARAADGREVTSRTFALVPFARVDWSLFTNSLNVGKP